MALHAREAQRPNVAAYLSSSGVCRSTKTVSSGTIRNWINRK
jgi:hypothetical protein